jgi:recombination protein RecR
VTNLDPKLFRPLVDGSLLLSFSAPGGPRRLRIDADHLVPGRNQGVEARHREIRRSHEDDAHRRALWRESGEIPISTAVASQEIETLANALARLPGLGPRSARRAVLHLMKKRESTLQPLLAALQKVSETLSTCSTCGNVDTSDPCGICRDPRRDDRSLCVVEEVADLWALDRSRLFPGRYHVLGGRLSALDGVRPEDLTIDQLVSRVSKGGVDEVVLAMNATLEGQTTAHYLAERLEGFPVRLTQLAHGLPVGGELDYLDEGTLAQALRARRPVA